MLDRVLTRGQFAGDGLGSAAASFECCRLVGSPDVLNMAPTLAHFYPKYPIRTSGMAAAFFGILGWLLCVVAEGVEAAAGDLGVDKDQRDKQRDTKSGKVALDQQPADREGSRDADQPR